MTVATRDEKSTRSIDTARQLLEDGIAAIVDGDSFQAWLRTVSRLHRYSWANCLLIGLQRPDASMIAGYTAWQKLGRQVRKGETGIRIFAPMARKADERGEERRIVTGFRAVSVFDIAQTDGDELPAPPQPVLIDAEHPRTAELIAALSAWCTAAGATVIHEIPANPRAHGSYDPKHKTICLRPDLPADHALKTLVHEAAHFAADHQLSEARSHVETVAESVAFVVLHHLGIDTGAFSFPYVAGWAQDTAILTANMATIQKVSHTLIDVLDAVSAQDGAPDA